MKKATLTVALLLVVAMLVSLPTSAASAATYLSKAQAESVTRRVAHEHYDTESAHVYVSCRPQGADRALRGYVYHRWACAWGADASDAGYDCPANDLILGRIVVIGSHVRLAYWSLVSGAHCTHL